ncbi:GIY-YIG nuclease family protein [Salmonella enterica]
MHNDSLASLVPVIPGQIGSSVPVPSDQRGGYIYVALSDIGLIKVGKTRNVNARMKQLSSGSGILITRVAVFGPFVNYGVIESSIQRRLAALRRSGEWFAGDFEDIKNIAESVTENEIAGTESTTCLDNRAIFVGLWLEAHECQFKYEKTLLPLLSDDALRFLGEIGPVCAPYVAEIIYSTGMITLHDGVTGYSVYPGGFEKALVSELKKDWITFKDKYPEDYDTDDDSEFTDYLVDTDDTENFRKEAEKWRNDRVMRIYTESVEKYQRWLTRLTGGDHA